MGIKIDPSKWQVHDCLSKIGNKSLRIQPDFQRYYIWDSAKEQSFIDSILRDYAIPPLWLWAHSNGGGETQYDVIDGQQRLTCILRYVHNKFPFKIDPDSPPAPELTPFNGAYYDTVPAGKTGKLMSTALTQRLKNYWLPYVLVETDNRTTVIDIFRRLNKSSTTLTPQELRNAFYDGKFKKAIYDFTAVLQKDIFWGHKKRMFYPDTRDRMGDQQYVSDLMVALMEGKPQDKSAKLDEYYKRFNDAFDEEATWKARFRESLSILKKIIPDFSRFTGNKADFYSLFLMIDEFNQDSDCMLSAKETIQRIREALGKFEKDYTEYLEIRESKPDSFPLLERYRETIVGRQREQETRLERAKIIRGLLKPLLTYKSRDPQRLFSDEQSLYIWQRSKKHVCCRCKKKVTIDEYEPDHFPRPWAKGGPTSISNGEVSHRHCNQGAGDRE